MPKAFILSALAHIACLKVPLVISPLEYDFLSCPKTHYKDVL